MNFNNKIEVNFNGEDLTRDSNILLYCRLSSNFDLKKSPMPYPVVHHSMAWPSTVAHVIYQKFVNALPLYRQEKEWESYRVKLSRPTMANWIMDASENWPKPLTDLMQPKLVEKKYLLDGNCVISNNVAENSIRPSLIEWSLLFWAYIGFQ